MNNLAHIINNSKNNFDYISSLHNQIIELRKKFYNYCNSLPFPLNRVLRAHYNERIKLSKGQPMLGEYAAFLLSDLFSVHPEITDKIAFPWLMLYEYCLLIDDLIDKSRTNDKQELLLSQFILHSSNSEFKKILGNNKILLDSFDLYFNEWTNAMLKESNWANYNKNHSRHSVVLEQGKKAAMVKYCATTIIYLSENRVLTKQEENTIDNICAGIQLLDDLADYEEDFKSGRMNLLLDQAYKWLITNSFVESSFHPLKQLDINQVKIAIVYSGALYKTWDAAAEYVNMGMNFFKNDSMSKKYFNSLIDWCRESSINVENTLKELPQYHNLLFNDQNIFDINEKPYSEIINIINSTLSFGPKASN